MKTVLIIIGILFALGLFGMLIPAIIAAGIAWLLFASMTLTLMTVTVMAGPGSPGRRHSPCSTL